MRLAGLKIGIGVPEGDFSGTVHSIFRNACILALDGRLITLVPARAGGLPAAVTVDCPGGCDLERLPGVGSAASSRAGILRMAGSRLSIDLRPAAPWRSALSILDIDLRRSPVLAAWQKAHEALEADGRYSALMAIAGPPMTALGAATRNLDAAAAGAAAAQLVGLGAGGTPAGDDFLVGYLTALWSSQRARGTEFVTRLSRFIAALAPRTSDISRVYLEAAAAGEVSERLTVLAATIATESLHGAVVGAAKAAIAVGHTSGADGTLGLLAGAEAASA